MAGYTTPSWVNGASPAINAAALTALGQGVELSQHPYGVCSTAAATAAKTVTLDYSGTLSLFTGLTVRVKFANSNTATSATLNVNGTGAKPIRRYGTASVSSWIAGQILEFVYDGSGWLLDSIDAYPRIQTFTATSQNAINNSTGINASTPDEAFRAIAQTMARTELKSYVGTGTYGASNPCSVTFSFVPKIFLIQESDRSDQGDAIFLLWGITNRIYRYDGGGSTVTYNGATASWYSTTSSGTQYNNLGVDYYLFAIG